MERFRTPVRWLHHQAVSANNLPISQPVPGHADDHLGVSACAGTVRHVRVTGVEDAPVARLIRCQNRAETSDCGVVVHS